MLKRLTLMNIQRHQYTQIDFPKTGVVRIYGNNSAGKTALFKPLYDLLENNLYSPRCRDELINRDSQSGIYTLELYNDYILSLNIAREASETYIQLVRPDSSMIKRYLSDKVMVDVLEELQFHYNKKRDLSLHIHKANTPLMFMSDSTVVNYDMLTEALNSPKAEKAIEAFKSLIDEIKKNLAIIENEQAVSIIQLDNLYFCDVEKEEEKINKMKELSDLISILKLPKLTEIKIVPDLYLMEGIDVSNINKNLRFQIIPIRDDMDLTGLKELELSNKLKNQFIPSDDVEYVLGLEMPKHILNEVTYHVNFVKSVENNICPTCYNYMGGEHIAECANY